MTDTPQRTLLHEAWHVMLLPKEHCVVIVDPDEMIVLEPGDLVHLHTMTGSRYWVARDPTEGRYWLTADNVASARSTALPHGTIWEVRPPLLLGVGLPALFLAPDTLTRDDPRRMPGGGKRTSLVREVVIHRGAVTQAAARRSTSNDPSPVASRDRWPMDDA